MELGANGDIEMNALRYGEAISQYTAALSLGPIDLQDLLAKRSKAYIMKGLWEDALNDANEVTHFSSSKFGHG